MCRSWKFWVVLAALGAGVVVVSPIPLTALVPLLVFAACPLMMIVGGGVIARGTRRTGRVSGAVAAGRVLHHPGRVADE